MVKLVIGQKLQMFHTKPVYTASAKLKLKADGIFGCVHGLMLES